MIICIINMGGNLILVGSHQKEKKDCPVESIPTFVLNVNMFIISLIFRNSKEIAVCLF